MVYAFVSAASSSDLETPLVPWFFTAEGNDERRKDRLAFILQQCQVQAAASERQLGVVQGNSRPQDVAGAMSNSNAIANSQPALGTPAAIAAQSTIALPSGVFRLVSGQFFSRAKSVVWLKQLNILFALVCEEGDSLLLARNYLQIFIGVLQDHARSSGYSSLRDLMDRPDEVATFIHVFLPNGILLIANQQLVKSLRRDAEALLSTRT